MTDKDSPAVRARRGDIREKRGEVVGNAEAGARERATTDEPRGRLHRVYTDVRIRAHHTNAELKMMREKASGLDGQHRRF